MEAENIIKTGAYQLFLILDYSDILKFKNSDFED